MKKLNLGCGEDYKNPGEGWVNLDNNKLFKADIYHDLNKIPYPFKANSFDKIYMKMILEHLDNPIEFLKDVIRISKKGAKIVLIAPHATSYANLTDIQHRTNFTESSFSKELLKEYNLQELILKKRDFIFHNKWKKVIPFKKYLKIFFNGLYEDLLFEFEVKK
ncbi:MAG: class I SAM-dependent methyltransferase [Nanoarchaeota archaeon]|nr:class I SAM-dependent methyltransferase [Nanoarchaeota archaeon]